MRFILIALLLVILLNVKSTAQGTHSAQFGVMMNRFKTEDHWKASHWTGFSTQAFGVTFSFYSGKNQQLDIPQFYPQDFKVGGHFLDVGYRYEFRKAYPLKRIFKKPWLCPTLGGGIGTYGLSGFSGFQFNMKPGIKLYLIPGVAVYAEAYAGYNIYFTVDDGYPTVLSTEEKVSETVKGTFLIPAIGVEFSTNLKQLIGDVWTKEVHLSGGWRSTEYTGVDGNRYIRHYYLPEGNYITDYVVHAKNILNFYGQIITGTGKTDRAGSLAGAAGLALRYGMFAADVGYQAGHIGYAYYPDTYHYPDERMQNYWKMSRSVFALGIDIMAIPRPFKLPSFTRLIISYKVGWQNLESVLNEYSTQVGTYTDFKPQLIKNDFYLSSNISFELGTLGIGWEFIFADNQTYRSGMLLTARYMIPLISAK